MPEAEPAAPTPAPAARRARDAPEARGERKAARLRRLALVLAALATLAALIGVDHRARQGRNALLKWGWAYAALERGEPIYGTGPATSERPTAEGFPTPPATLVLLLPFHSLGPRWGPLAWAAACAALAWWVVLGSLGLAAGRARDFPAAGTCLVLAIAGRVLYSELQHGNIDLAVAATVLAAARAWSRSRDARAGAWLGVGAALKVTPALGLLWLARARSGRGLAGFAVGLVAALLVVPGAWLGVERDLELLAQWWRQMVLPYLSGAAPGAVQSEHINQSLLGVLARHLTDAVAIAARPPVHPTDVRIGWLDLGPGALRRVHAAAALGIVALLWRALPRPAGERSGPLALRAGALLSLAMVFLSERSWKHHYVVLPLALAHLAHAALESGRGRARRRAWTALSVAGLGFVATGEGLLGAAGADLAEALGAYFAAGFVLFAAVLATPPPGSGERG